MGSLLPQGTFDRLRAMAKPYKHKRIVKSKFSKNNISKVCKCCNFRFETWQSKATFCSGVCRAKYHQSIQKQASRKKIIELKRSLSCIRCGERHPACLDFHHRDPKAKSFTISDSISHYGFAWSRILEEIGKCDIICSNCHRKEHWANPIASDIRMEKEINVRTEDSNG